MVLNQNILDRLKDFYPEYTLLKDGQKEVLEAVFSGDNVLAIMPTGSGKSLCYQFPALLNAEQKKMTIIISPLVALMKDQYNKIKNKGIEVNFLNSTIPYSEQKLILQKVTKGEL
ncbi:MAG: DEAD/DEAH box helicase [Candidatus Methanofastidiosa archaeon]|nr:DEAD/DEAH box helicase [Candidatus Methanofastidiosa archaeon]